MAQSNEQGGDELGRVLWHALSAQMTHAYNCKDVEHTKSIDGCLAFTQENFEHTKSAILADRKQHELEARERLIEEIISKGKSTFAKKKEWGDLKYIEVETIKTFITDAELSELKAEREAM